MIFSGVSGYYLTGGDYGWFLVLPFVLVVASLLRSRIVNVADLLMVFYFHLYIFPLMYLSSGHLYMFILVGIICIFSICFWWCLERFQKPAISVLSGVERFKYIDRLSWAVVFALCFLLVVSFVMAFPPISSLSYVNSLYEVRGAFKQDVVGLRSYIFTIMEYVGLPLLIYLAFKSKRRIVKVTFVFLIAWLVLQIFLYSALKSALLVPFYIVAGALLISDRKYLPLSKALSLILIVGASIVLVSSLLGSWATFVSDYLLRRLLLSPSTNAFYFLHSYFEGSGFISSGIKGMGQFVSINYYGVEGNSTTGFFADAFARYGVLGGITFSFIIPIYFWTIKYASKLLPLQSQYLIFGVSIYVLLNTSILTAQLTYGMFVLIMLGVLIRFLFSVRVARVRSMAKVAVS